MIWQTTLLIQVTDWLGSIKNMAQSSGGLLSVLSPFLYYVCMAESQIMGLVCTHNSLAPRLREFVGSFGIMDLPFYVDPKHMLYSYDEGKQSEIFCVVLNLRGGTNADMAPLPGAQCYAAWRMHS